MTFKTDWDSAMQSLSDDTSPELGGDLVTKDFDLVGVLNSADPLNIYGANSDGGGPAGAITIEAGQALVGNTFGTAANLTLKGGTSLIAGAAASNGGNLQLRGGNATASTSGNGGNIDLQAGNGSATGGDILLTPGTGTTAGEIKLGGVLNLNFNVMRNGTPLGSAVTVNDNFDVYTTNSTTLASISGSSDDANSKAKINLIGTRGTTASPTAIQSGDVIGHVNWDGHDGTTTQDAAIIEVAANETYVDAGDLGATEMDFRVKVSGSNTLVSKFKITDTEITVTEPFEQADGDLTNPSYAFTSETNTGMFRPGGGSIGFSIQGTERMRIVNTGIDASVPMGVDDGTASSPTYRFNTDTNTGFFKKDTDQLGVATGGKGSSIKNGSITTSNATPLVMLAIPVASGTSVRARVEWVATDTTNSEGGHGEVEAAAYNNVGTLGSIAGEVVTNNGLATSGGAVSVNYNDTTDEIEIVVTGAGSTTINWAATATVIEA